MTAPLAGSDRRLAIRVRLLPRDTNEAGSIFGGIILAHIDLAGAVEAERYAPAVPGVLQPFVTKTMREVVFHSPVYVGDLVSFYTRTVRLGRTSVTVHVEVEVTRQGSHEHVRVTEAEVVYVAVDKQWKPTPIRMPSEPPPA